MGSICYLVIYWAQLEVLIPVPIALIPVALQFSLRSFKHQTRVQSQEITKWRFKWLKWTLRPFRWVHIWVPIGSNLEMTFKRRFRTFKANLNVKTIHWRISNKTNVTKWPLSSRNLFFVAVSGVMTETYPMIPDYSSITLVITPNLTFYSFHLHQKTLKQK